MLGLARGCKGRVSGRMLEVILAKSVHSMGGSALASIVLNAELRGLVGRKEFEPR